MDGTPFRRYDQITQKSYRPQTRHQWIRQNNHIDLTTSWTVNFFF